MPRPKYAGEHQRLRAQLLAQLQPGSPCVRCGHPMDPAADRLELDHRDDGDGYLGLAHGSPCAVCGRRCNQAAGGEKAARQAGRRLRARRCMVCGMPYRATSGSSGARQQTCGQPACVAEAKRRTWQGGSPAADAADGEPPQPSGRTW